MPGLRLVRIGGFVGAGLGFCLGILAGGVRGVVPGGPDGHRWAQVIRRQNLRVERARVRAWLEPTFATQLQLARELCLAREAEANLLSRQSAGAVPEHHLAPTPEQLALLERLDASARYAAQKTECDAVRRRHRRLIEIYGPRGAGTDWIAP
jgi:hypothetical protein